MKRLTIISILFLLFMSACSDVSLLSGLFKAGSSDEGIRTDLIDDFSDNDSGWETFRREEGSAGYSKGVYKITVNLYNADIFSTFTRTFANSENTVWASRVEGSENNNFGIICRFQDKDNFYSGQISSDGYAGIFKVENGNYQLLGHDQMIQSPMINGGEEINEVRFDCIQETLTLMVNGENIDNQKDDAFWSGEVGLIAGNVDGNYGVFHFDEFSAMVR